MTVGLIGSGGATLMLLVFVLGLASGAAMSASLFAVFVTSLTGAVAHARAGRVAWRAGALFGLAGMAGACGGDLVMRVLPRGSC